MQAARPTFLALTLALPFTAWAVPFDDLLVLEYEGTISAISDEVPPPSPQQYVVGNPISGRLLIDRGLVTPGSDPTPTHALYRSGNPAFVSGFWSSTGDGFDQVSLSKGVVRDGDRGPIDTFSAEDFYVVQNGSLDGARVFGIRAGVRGFLDDVSLDQSFELTAADADEPAEYLGGSIRWSSIHPFALVTFVVDRLKVKPGRCFAP